MPAGISAKAKGISNPRRVRKLLRKRRYRASTITNDNFISSDGSKLIPPRLIHAHAPFTGFTPGTGILVPITV